MTGLSPTSDQRQLIKASHGWWSHTPTPSFFRLQSFKLLGLALFPHITSSMPQSLLTWFTLLNVLTYLVWLSLFCQNSVNPLKVQSQEVTFNTQMTKLGIVFFAMELYHFSYFVESGTHAAAFVLSLVSLGLLSSGMWPILFLVQLPFTLFMYMWINCHIEHIVWCCELVWLCPLSAYGG